MQIKNIAAGPRGLHFISGSRVIAPGETVDGELSEAEFEGAKATGWFSIEGAPKTDEDDGLDRDDLKKQADELGITYARNIKTDALKALIDAKLVA